MFEEMAEKVLNELAIKLEGMEELEVNLSEGVLTIKAQNGDYAINKHIATQSIWYSSPVSSLKYFILNGEIFVDKKNLQITLDKALFSDLLV